MTALASLARPLALLVLVALLGACANGRDLGEMRPELGDFRLAHNIVVAANAQQGPFSREATPEQWEEAIRAEVARRFERYEGDRLYHIAVSVDGYILAVPGVPLVASPRSALIIGVHLWDDELGQPINEERRQFTVLESLSGETVVSSGLTQSAEQQMLNLSRNAALMIENWLAQNPQWFNTGATVEETPEAVLPADTAAVEDETEPAEPDEPGDDETGDETVIAAGAAATR